MRFPFIPASASVHMLRMRSCLILVFWVCTMVRASGELIVGKPEWGFNGGVVENSFNILTIEVRNAGRDAFEGDIVLDDGGPFGGGSMAPCRQPVFLAPGTARFVQFYPYIGSGFSNWMLRWKDAGGGQVPIENLKREAPAVVILIDPTGYGARTLRMRAFDEAHFPPTVSATTGLHAVVLDHQPRWDPVRREAFLDWFRKGGIVHVLPGPDGGITQFSDELAALNTIGTSPENGGGLVVRHALPTSEITDDFLSKAGYPTPEASDDSNWRYDQSDHALFRQLSAVTRPNISWGVIYLLTAVYVLLVGPAFYFLRKRDYRVLLLSFLLTVGLFAWIFTVVGRRGYGEKQIYHSLAVAQSVGGARWDVRHWVHPFATSGDEYRFQYKGPSQLYAAMSQGESVRGTVLQGKDSVFIADIPLFSSRSFLHQGVLGGPDFQLKLAEFDAGTHRTSLEKFRIEAGPNFPSDPAVVFIQYRGQYHLLEKRPNGWSLAKNSATSGENLFEQANNHRRSNYYDSPQTSREWLRNAAGVLGRFVSLDNRSKPHPHRFLRTDQIRVFVYVNAPQDFPLMSEEFEAGLSYVLFVQDLNVPSPKDSQKLATNGSSTRH